MICLKLYPICGYIYVRNKSPERDTQYVTATG
jgi:hypothetical protein